jgi:hypothetical protein
MIIKTTINIKTEYCDLLELAASITGQSRRSIISMIMIRLAADHDMIPCHWKRIRYQARGQRGHYRRLHLSIQEPEYELYLDLKKFCKQSVSRLIACAIDLYLNDLIFNFNHNKNNYQLNRYSMNKTIINGSICWFLQWEVTANQNRHKKLIT